MKYVRDASIGLRRTGWMLVFVVLVWVLGGGASVHAQVIPVRTVPVAAGSQFEQFPSRTRAMGGLSIVVNDRLGDALANPAKAGRVDGTLTFSSLTYYTITGPDGSARTLSVGAVHGGRQWFGGLGVALQQLRPGFTERTPGLPPQFGVARLPRRRTSFRPYRPLREESAENQYLTGFGGRWLTDRLAVAGRVHWSRLNAMDGVDLLYPGNDGLRQDGHRVDVRLGVLWNADGQSLSGLLLHNRIDMEHDIRYVEWTDPGFSTLETGSWRVRTEEYFDRTNTWGLHLEYVRAFGSNGWQVGAMLTGNRKNHPKIPNYELMNIPRDPGLSWAYDLGIGLSQSDENTTFGIEFIYEPIVSETWANAQEPIPQPGGGTLRPGEKKIVNDFTFANTTLRTGVAQRGSGWNFRLGAEVHTIRYWLTQTDRVVGLSRDQYEGWSEWQLSWGGGIEWGDVRFQYAGHLTLGTGRPAVFGAGARASSAAFAASTVVAPRGSLTLQDRRLYTHQLSVVVPVGER